MDVRRQFNCAAAGSLTNPEESLSNCLYLLLQLSIVNPIRGFNSVSVSEFDQKIYGEEILLTVFRWF